MGKVNALKAVRRSYRGRIFVLCLLTLLTSVLQVLVALLTRYVIDAAIYSNGKLWIYGCLLAVDLLTIILLNSAINWYSGSVADRFAATLRKSMLRSAVFSKDIRLQGFHSGQLLSRGMEDVNAVCDGSVNVLPNFVGQIARLIAAFAAIFLISPVVAMVLAGAAVVMIIAISLIRPMLKKHHKLVRQADEKVMSTMQEDLQQLELIQSLDAQDNILQRFRKRLRDSLSAKKKRRVFSVSISTILNICTQAGTGMLLLWGAVQVSQAAMTYGALTALLQLIGQFRNPVLSLSGLWTRLAAVEVAGERLFYLLEEPEKVQPAQVGRVSAIVFENVSFTYPSDEQPVLQNFSARFPLEQWACLTGISGKGKSTLFKLILGLYTPEKGSVYLETENGNVPCSEQTRNAFAYVPQDFALFSGTIEENLQLVSDADPCDALEIAQAGFVKDLSAGLQTQIRENNSGLSKGQLQRLAIARAILMERPILLLDECTSALDNETEKAVLEKLHKMGKQAVLVTHRPESLTDLDGIVSVKMEQ